MKLQSRSRSNAQRFLRAELIRHGALVFAATTLVNVFNYVFHFAISRKLGVVGYGTLSSLIAGLTIVSVPASVLNIIVVKFAAEFHAVADHAKLRRLSTYVIRLSLTMSTFVLGVGLLLRSSVAAYLKVPNDASIIFALIVICLNLVLPGARGILQGTQDFKRYAMSAGLEAVSKATLGIGLVYLGFGALGAIVGYVCGTCISLLYTVAVMGIHFSSEKVRLSVDFRRLVATSAGVALATLGLTLLAFMDVVLVKHFFSPKVAGIYSALSLTGKMLLFVVGFIPTVVLPKAASQASLKASSTLLLKFAGLGTLAISGCGLLSFYCFPALAIRVVAGAAFLQASQYVFQYGVIMTVVGAIGLVTTYKIGLHRFDFLAPLLIAVVAEIVAISFVHRTIWDVMNILLLGHCAALVGSLYKITRLAPITHAVAGAHPVSAHG